MKKKSASKNLLSFFLKKNLNKNFSFFPRTKEGILVACSKLDFEGWQRFYLVMVWLHYFFFRLLRATEDSWQPGLKPLTDHFKIRSLIRPDVTLLIAIYIISFYIEIKAFQCNGPKGTKQLSMDLCNSLDYGPILYCCLFYFSNEIINEICHK